MIPVVSVREGLEVYIGNAVTLAVINLLPTIDVLMKVGQLLLVAGTVIFTFYKTLKMRAEARKAAVEEHRAEREDAAAQKQKPPYERTRNSTD